MDGGETERRSATTDATTHGNDGRERRTAATDGCDGGRTATTDCMLRYDKRDTCISHALITVNVLGQGTHKVENM